MKPTTLLLVASLVANVAFVTVFVSRPGTTSLAPTPTVPSGTATAGRSASADMLRAALASGDAAALEAAGISPALAREIALGRTFARLADKLHTQGKSSADDRWWRLRPGANPAARQQQLAARRELSDALVAALGDDLGLSGDRSQLAFLPAAKREGLRRITQDYDEMFAKFGAGGVQLPSDREKLRLLRLERERDIATLLSPDELLAYEMRTSPSGNTIRSRYGDAIDSESEFQKIYALQKAFDDKFPREALTGRITPEVMRARSEAERQLETEIRGAVGDDRYATLRRAADGDVRMVDSLAQRLNLPPATTDNVLASRDTFSAESQRINNDASLSVPQRRAQIQALATQAKTDLTRALGTEAAEAYSQRSPWLNLLQSGMAYSTTPPEGTAGSFFPGAGPSIYPVMPAGANPGATQRSFVVNATPPLDGAAPADAFTGGNVQVMSFASTSSTIPDSAAAATPVDGQPVRRITVPAPASPAPETPPPSEPQPKR